MKLTVPLGIVILVILALTSGAFYTVDETEQVIITQFGRPVGDTIIDPGLHFKIPFIQKANFFPKNILEWDGDPSQIPTLDKTYIWVDTFARWRIVDALKFFRKVNNEISAQNQLDSILNSETRNLISSLPLIESIRSSGRDSEEMNESEGDQAVPFEEQIEVGREQITNMIREKAAPKVEEFGIELVDLGIKRINYIQDVRKKVFERMIAERRQIAEKFRSEGQGQSREIEGRMEKELKSIQAEAYRLSEEIKGKADAEAAGIYAEAYGKDPEFYAFVRTLDIYKNLPEKEIELIITTDSDFFKYLEGIE